MFTCPAQATRRPARSSSETDVILRWRNIAGCRFSILDAVVLCPKKCAGAGHNSQCRENCDRDKKRKLLRRGKRCKHRNTISECGTLCSRASTKICKKVHVTVIFVLYRLVSSQMGTGSPIESDQLGHYSGGAVMETRSRFSSDSKLSSSQGQGQQQQQNNCRLTQYSIHSRHHASHDIQHQCMSQNWMVTAACPSGRSHQREVMFGVLCNTIGNNHRLDDQAWHSDVDQCSRH